MDEGQKRARNNAARLQECWLMFQSAAAELAKPSMDGKITLEMSAKAGYFGRPKKSIESWGALTPPHST